MGDEDQSLWDDDNLDVDNHVQLFVIVINGLTGCISEANTKCILVLMITATRAMLKEYART